MTTEHNFIGFHVLGEMYGIDGRLLDDVAFLEEALVDGIARSGATVCDRQVKKFEPSGVTILALLSESHASIHTYPGQGALFFDAFTCGTECQPELIAQVLIERLNPSRHELQTIERGSIDLFESASHLPLDVSSTLPQ